MTQHHNFDTPRHCIIDVRGNTSPGKICLVGVDACGANITEESSGIPAPLSSETWTFVSRYAYSDVSVVPEGLGYPEITVGSIEPMKYTTFPQSSKIDKEALRTMIRDEIRASIKDIATEVAKEFKKQLRLQGNAR